MAEHLPWRVHEREDGSISLDRGDPLHGPHDAFDFGWDHQLAEQFARAVNSHDELLDALRKAGEAIHSEYCGRQCQPQCVAVEAAIAKAEAK
jgi:hypothetical protein